MTEFSFSTWTFQRDLAKPAQITNWAHPRTPTNPLGPMPGEDGSVDGVLPATTPFVPRHSVSECAEMEAAAVLSPTPRREPLPSYPFRSSPSSASLARSSPPSPQTTASHSILLDSAWYGQSYLSDYSRRSSWSKPWDGPCSWSRSPHESQTSMPPSRIAPVLAFAANTGRGMPCVPQQAQLARPMAPRSMSEQSEATIGAGRVGVPSPYGYSLEVLGGEAPRRGHSLIPSVSLASFTLSEASSLNTHATLPADCHPSVQLEGNHKRLCI